MTESFDSDSREGDQDIVNTFVRKFGRDSEIDREMQKALKHGQRHGRHKTRILGKTDLTDIPPGLSQKIMPLPWGCDQCGKPHLSYVFQCVLCGWLSPLGLINWRR